jgi:two-component system, NtrC family, sensor kinase
MTMAKNKFGILYVDDETISLKYFAQAFGEIAPIFIAASAEEGLEVFANHVTEIGVVLSDKKMPGMSGIDFLKKVRQIDDEPLRILVTAHTDLKLAVESLNDGLLYSYLTKPWDPRDLKYRLEKALDRFWITRERNKLLRERGAAFQEMMMAEKAANIQTISTGLNHHMRNSLNVIQAYFDMIPLQLREEIGEVKKDSFFWNDFYQNVEEQIARVISILSSLSESAGTLKHTELELTEDVDLVEVINHAAKQEIGDDPKYQFILTPKAPIDKITADFKRISLMAAQLIREAKKNLKEAGVIEIQIFPAQIDGVEAVRVRIIDNGVVIPESERPHLFDPLFIRSDRPMDISTDLLNCYLTVFNHGGKIQASSLSDQRNVMEFTLPKTPNLQATKRYPIP